MPTDISTPYIPRSSSISFRGQALTRALPLLAALALVACSGSGGGGANDTQPPGTSSTTGQTEPAAFNGGIADSGLLMLLVPDTQSLTDDRVSSWTDAASEVGTRMAMVTDSQFLAMGTARAMRYAGLVLPDQLHTVASDAVVRAVRDYTTQGGHTLLTFDFAALTLNGSGQAVYPIPKSRLSDLAGVDYVLYSALLARTVGLGPVTAMRSTLRELLVPPGKSMPFTPAPLVRAAASVGNVDPASGQSLYLPVSTADPGGLQGFDPQQFQKPPLTRGKAAAPQVSINYGHAFKAAKVGLASATLPTSHLQNAPSSNLASGDSTPPVANAKITSVDVLEAYHGYLLGNLIYPSYVTSGRFTGTTLASAPDFGLVAGVNQVGAGKVLFVNLPLGYLKGRTDGLPMHGFLNYFMQHVVHGARLSTMPNGVAGLTFDWHLDSMDAQAHTLALEAAGVFDNGPFSMEMTAGPDAVVPGDGLGWNLNNNTVAQQLLRRLDAKQHAIGSHGGWVHDFYGDGATEFNAAEFLPLLQQNQAAVDGALGKRARSYSAPMGTNPRWAMAWLEQQGIVGAYFGGHTGLGATRQYRDGALLNPALWVFPVTPQGRYATFEEFQDYKVPKQDVINWYHALVDFSVSHNTSRLIYAHPPGANRWRDVLTDLLSYAQSMGAQFQWYTMPRLADFMTNRRKVGWTQTTLATGETKFDASHPKSLDEMVWMLPKDRYLAPTIVSGTATVVDNGTLWLVKAGAVQQLQFRSQPNLRYVPR